jgi:hypothetical protein
MAAASAASRKAKGDHTAMCKIRSIVMAFYVALALSALVAGTASAAGWSVGGAELPVGSKQALATAATVTESPVLNVPSLGIKISCSKLSGKEPEIIGTTTGKAKSFTFGGCSELAPPKCSVESEIPTEPVQADPASREALEEGLLVTPQSGTILASIIFSGSSCSIAGEKPLKGKVVLNAPTLFEEVTEQRLEGLGTLENSSLEIGGNKAYIEGGKMGLKLANGKPVKFGPGIVVLPKAYKFKKVGEKKTFNIYNIQAIVEEVKSAQFVPSKEEKNFKVTAGFGCYEAKVYAADPNKEKPCAVTIEELVAGKLEKFELVPFKEPVEFATLSS